MLITLALLEELNACVPEKHLFSVLWPNGAEITVENYFKAEQHDMSISWLAKNCLILGAYEEYAGKWCDERTQFYEKLDELRSDYERGRITHDEWSRLYAELVRNRDLNQAKLFVEYMGDEKFYSSTFLSAVEYVRTAKQVSECT